MYALAYLNIYWKASLKFFIGFGVETDEVIVFSWIFRYVDWESKFTYLNVSNRTPIESSRAHIRVCLLKMTRIGTVKWKNLSLM